MFLTQKTISRIELCLINTSEPLRSFQTSEPNGSNLRPAAALRECDEEGAGGHKAARGSFDEKNK